MTTVIGQPATHIHSPDKVAGRTRYTADLRLPGTLWGKCLRSPYPHARIVRIDAARARGAPGVHAVITAADLPDVGTGLSHFACAWPAPPPPTATTHTGNNPEELIDPSMASELEIGSEADPLMGRLTIDHPLAGHRALGQPEQLHLVYTSTSAHPHPILTSHTSLAAGAPTPLATSATLSVNGVPQGPPVFWQGSSQLAREALTFNALGLATGLYTAALSVVNHYQASATGSAWQAAPAGQPAATLGRFKIIESMKL